MRALGTTCELFALTASERDRLLADRRWAIALLEGEQRAARSLKLEKAWHGLHVLLTGPVNDGDPPLNFLLHGGRPLFEDRGDDPPRLFGPMQVRRLDRALSGISEKAFWDRFDRARLVELELYSNIWDEPEADLHDEYVGYLNELKRFVHEASANGLALVVSVGDGEQIHEHPMEAVVSGPLGPKFCGWGFASSGR